MNRLWPPIAVIECGLPGARVAEEADEVSPEGPLAESETVSRDENAAVPADMTIPPVSEALEELIERRAAARAASFSTSPAPGQAIVIEPGADSTGDDTGDRALTVMLNEPSDTPEVWHGWIAAPEAAYCGFWDFVLQEAADDPFDPACAMVQVWNPVFVRIPDRPRVLAELKPRRLTALRALAHEFSQGLAAPAGVRSRPGGMWQRLVAGHQVFTGTPLGDSEDPRWRYQEVYLRAAETVRAVVTRGETETESMVSRVARRIRAWAATAGQSWTPVDLVPEPMGEGVPAGPVSFQLGSWLRVALIPDERLNALQVRASLTGNRALQLALLRGKEILQKQEISPERRTVDLFLELDGTHALHVTDPVRGTQHRIPLT